MRSLLFTLVMITCSFASARSVKGYYEVPTSEELKPFAHYPIRCSADTYQTDPSVMTFSLPKELVGNLESFTMHRSKTNPQLWEGQNVTGSCAKQDRYLRCEVRFKNLNINMTEVQQIISNKFNRPEELAGKQKIADQFAREGEPIGFIVYKLRGRDRY